MTKQKVDKEDAVPRNTMHLLWIMLTGIVKNLPKMFIYMAIMAVVSFVAIYYLNIYAVAGVNNGFLKISIRPDNPWYYLLNFNYGGHNNQAAFNALCLFFFGILSALLHRIFSRGIKVFLIDMVRTPGYVIKCLRESKRHAAGVFFFTLAIIMFVTFAKNLAMNYYLMFTWSFGFLMTFTLQYQTLPHIFLTYLWQDFQKIFKKDRERSQLDSYSVSMCLLALFFGFLLLGYIRNQPIIPIVLSVFFMALGFLTTTNKIRPKAAMNLFMFLFTGILVYTLHPQSVFAHDGGRAEAGGTWRAWRDSVGADAVRQSGVRPGLLGSLGSLLGGLISSGANAASNAASAVWQGTKKTAEAVVDGVSSTVQSVKETASYVKEVAVGTVINIGQDLAEAGRTIRDFAGSAWEGTKQMASDTAQAARDIYNNPGLIRDTFVLTAGQIKDGVVSVVQETAQIAREVWNDPRIISETVMGTGRDIVNIGSNIGNAIYTTVTDPKKAWEAVKEITGINNFQNSWDPNRSLIERIGQVGIGTLKIYGTIVTAGKIGAAVKTGATKVSGVVGAVKTGKTAGAVGAVKGGKTAAAIKSTAPRSLPVARPGDAQQIATFNKMKRAGANKVDDFISALKSKDPARIKQATLRVQGDPQAIANINGRNNFVKNQFNNQVQQVYRQTDRRVVERIAREYNVRPDQVRVVSATNPNRNLTNVKVGFDRDITYRVGGRDVPADRLQRVYNQEFTRVTGVKDPSRLGQTAVDRMHAEAYGRNPSDLQKVLHGQSHRVGDSQQIGKTISYKANHAFSEAARATDPQTALNHTFDGMRQTTKQWNNQVRSTIDYFNSQPGTTPVIKVPSRLQEAIKVMDQINHGVSPTEITQRLRGLGMTPSDVATQAGDFFEAIMTLR